MPPEGREVEFSKFDTSRLSRHRLNCSNRAETLHAVLNYQSLEENQRKEIIWDIVHFILRPNGDTSDGDGDGIPPMIEIPP